jgi:Family of unknown function (DUF6312)
MRVRVTTGVKRVTVLRPNANRGDTYVLSGARDVAVADDIKFVLIDGNGRVSRGVVRTELGPVKRQSRLVKRIDRQLRKLARSEHRALGRYLILHERSKRLHRNGWVRDLGKNLREVIRRSS